MQKNFVENEIRKLIRHKKTYQRISDIEQELGYKRGMLGYLNVNVTELNIECGFVRRQKVKLKNKPSITKEDFIEKIKTIIISENRYISRSELHKFFKIQSNFVTHFDINVHSLNIELGFHKNSPMGKINGQKLKEDICEYISNSDNYVPQDEICNRFNISLSYLTKSNIDTVKLNREYGNKGGLNYFESLVWEVLKEIYTDIVTQKTFNNCRSDRGRMLRFDFYIPSINTVIEADGSQHWDTSHKFYSKLNKNRDDIKNRYCKTEGINLIRIPYIGRFKTTKSYVKHILETSESFYTTTQLETANVKVKKIKD